MHVVEAAFVSARLLAHLESKARTRFCILRVRERILDQIGVSAGCAGNARTLIFAVANAHFAAALRGNGLMLCAFPLDCIIVYNRQEASQRVAIVTSKNFYTSVRDAKCN